MQININSIVRVELTEYGNEILSKKMVTDYYSGREKSYPGMKGNMLTTELWDIMRIFGDCLWMGNTYIPFKNNEITFVEPIDKNNI